MHVLDTGKGLWGWRERGAKLERTQWRTRLDPRCARMGLGRDVSVHAAGDDELVEGCCCRVDVGVAAHPSVADFEGAE